MREGRYIRDAIGTHALREKFLERRLRLRIKCQRCIDRSDALGLDCFLGRGSGVVVAAEALASKREIDLCCLVIGETVDRAKGCDPELDDSAIIGAAHGIGDATSQHVAIKAIIGR